MNKSHQPGEQTWLNQLTNLKVVIGAVGTIATGVASMTYGAVSYVSAVRTEIVDLKTGQQRDSERSVSERAGIKDRLDRLEKQQSASDVRVNQIGSDIAALRAQSDGMREMMADIRRILIYRLSGERSVPQP